MEEVPVLIVGGGPVGLTASILLSQAGIRSLLVERHPGTLDPPQGTRHQRTDHGALSPVRRRGCRARRGNSAPPHRNDHLGANACRRGDRTPHPWRATAQSGTVSPVRNCLCAQDYLEPVLRTFAEQQGPGELRFSTEATAFEPQKDGVVVTIVDRDSGEQQEVRAAYVIAADGAPAAFAGSWA